MTEPKSDLMQRLDAWLEEGKAHVAELMKRRQELLQELAKIDMALRAVKGTPAKPAVVVTTHRDYRTIILECLQDANIPLSVKQVQRRVNSVLREIGSTKHLTDTTIRGALNKFVLEGTVRKSLESPNPSSGFIYERIRKQMTNPETTNAKNEEQAKTGIAVGYLRVLQTLLHHLPKTPEGDVTLALVEVAIKSIQLRQVMDLSAGPIGTMDWSNSIDKLHQVIRETQLVDVTDGVAQSSVDHGKPTTPGVDVDLLF